MPLFYIKIIKFQQFFSCCLDAVVGASLAIGVVGKQQRGGVELFGKFPRDGGGRRKFDEFIFAELLIESRLFTNAII